MGNKALKTAGMALVLAAMVVLAVGLTACENPVVDDSDNGNGDGDNGFSNGSSYTGTVFKGPFQVGAAVAVLELDANLQQTGRSFFGDITDDSGAYRIDAAPFTGPVELIATGVFFDEVANILRGEITLRAITDEDGTVNVNVATAIQRDRIRELVAAGQTFAAAQSQAMDELWSVFGWSPLADKSRQISINGADGDKLLALSAMMARTPHGGTRSMTEMNALITTLRTDFADGALSKDNRDTLHGSSVRLIGNGVRDNLQNYYNDKGISVTVPSIAGALDSFIESVPMVTVSYDDGNFIRPALAGARAGEMGMGRTDGFTLSSGSTIVITVTGDTGYFNIGAQDFTETSPGVYEASGLGYRQLGVSFANIQTDINGDPEVASYTVTIDVSGVDNFTIAYTVTY